MFFTLRYLKYIFILREIKSCAKCVELQSRPLLAWPGTGLLLFTLQLGSFVSHVHWLRLWRLPAYSWDLRNVFLRFKNK